MPQNHFIHKLLAYTALLLLALSTLACSSQSKNQHHASQEPSEYPVLAVSPLSVTTESEYPTTVRGKLDVEIRPQVSGQIVRLAVDEGMKVRKGQLLFEIDPVQYRERVNAAEAAVKVAESTVATAQLTVNNNTQLSEGNVIGPYTLQTSENALLTAKAGLAQAKAQLVAAQQSLAFTRVTSPTDGIVGSIPFRVGSLVSPSMAQPLTTVSDISEVYAHISLSERDLLVLTKEKQTTEEMISSTPPVDLFLLDGTPFAHKGKLATLSGNVDLATGTINARILFPNPEGILRSGSSAIVSIPTHLDNVYELPLRSIYHIQERSFVYLVDSENVVHSKEIKSIDRQNGKTAIVTDGLSSGDRIVLDGIITLREGMTIRPTNPKDELASSLPHPAVKE